VTLVPSPVPLQEIIEFLQQLVSIPSVKSEQAIATYIAQKLTRLGFEPHLLGAPEHPSVICHHQVTTATKTIWLQSHLDTTPVGDRFTLRSQSFQNSEELCFQSLSIPTTWVVVGGSIDL